MKRLSKASNSIKPRAAAHEHFYEAEDEKITAQKAKFASLYEEAETDDLAKEEEDDDVAGHGVGRQPRKTCKLSSSKHGGNRHQQEQQQKKFVCPKCGKGFQSSKAMCGHMACHSQKDKASNNSAAKQKPLVMDSHSDTESGAKNRSRMSSRRRSKVDVSNNCSSEASGVEQEQEEVAICLMMLSRDSANWGGLNSVGNSTDNNSVVLEARSISTKLASMDGLKSSGYGVVEATNKCGSKKVKALGDFESGFVRNESENGETDVKTRYLKRNKLQEGYESEPHLSLKKLKTAVDGCLKYDFSKDGERSKMDSSAEMYRNFEHKTPIHSHGDSNAYGALNKKSLTSVPLHGSGQSPDNLKGKGILEEKSGNVGDNWKSGKYECSACVKVLRSAQALGSHRMQHLHEGTKKINKCDSVAAMFKRNRTQVHDSIDLNLPAPMEDEEAIETMDRYCYYHEASY